MWNTRCIAIEVLDVRPLQQDAGTVRVRRFGFRWLWRLDEFEVAGGTRINWSANPLPNMAFQVQSK